MDNDSPGKLAIKAVDEIKEKVGSFGRDKTHGFLVTLKTDLEKLEGAEIIKRSESTVHKAMENLNKALQKTKETVTTKCKSIKDILEAFKKYGITTKLDELRKVIAKGMLSAVLASIIMGTSSKNKDETKENIAAVYALHGPLRELERLISQLSTVGSSSNNEKRKNKTDGDKPKLRNFNKWSDLHAKTTTGRKDIRKKVNSNYIYKADLDKDKEEKKDKDKDKVDKKDKDEVVIKKIHVSKEELKEKEQFSRELQLLRKLKHPNIVELVGFCYEYSGSLVVPEKSNDVKFEGNGDLGIISIYASEETMDDVNKGNVGNLNWPHLFEIIKGIANGVHYMHKERVVHLNLKPQNILMKGIVKNAQPQINKIRKARELEDGAQEIALTAESLPAKGKYVDPKLQVGAVDSATGGFVGKFWKYKASTKSDVYSFGVILLETIGLRCATTVSSKKEGCATTSTSESDQFPHPKAWARMIKESDVKKQFDENGLLTGEAQRTEAEWCVIVGLLCCMTEPAHRPSMGDVIEMLGS